ncbi:MAG: hypothetical protein ABIR70_22410 [Bryobacteraceae bacterium]
MKKFALPLFFGALLASAQMSIQPLTNSSYRGQGDAQGNSWGTLSITLRTPVPPALLGAPFSAKEERKSEQLLPEGGRLTLPSSTGVTVSRDALGRTRLERSLSQVLSSIPGRPAQIPLMIVEINDVVDGYYYVLDPAKKIAYRMKYSPAQPRSIPVSATPRGFQVKGALIPGGSAENAPQINVEPLGSKYIQGVQAEGLRQTTVYPVGSRGNDRPMTDVNETWTVPSLQLQILQSSKTPTSNTTFELTNLSTLNPTPDQFRPPPSYEVRDQPESFTVEFGNRPPGTQR